jgi:hypothetical protein
MDFKTKQVILGMTFSKRLLLLSGFTVFMVMQACSPDNSDTFLEDTIPQPNSFTYTAKLNGNSWSAKQNLSLLVKNSLGSPSKEMRLSANSTDGKLITLSLEDASTGVAGDGIPTQTYVMKGSGNDNASFLLVDTKLNKTYIGAYGTVVVSVCDAVAKTISGTFECTLYQSAGDSIKVTSGVFSKLPYEIREE